MFWKSEHFSPAYHILGKCSKTVKMATSACKSFLDFVLGPRHIWVHMAGQKPSPFHTLFSHILHIVVGYTVFTNAGQEVKIPNVLYIYIVDYYATLPLTGR